MTGILIGLCGALALVAALGTIGYRHICERLDAIEQKLSGEEDARLDDARRRWFEERLSVVRVLGEKLGPSQASELVRDLGWLAEEQNGGDRVRLRLLRPLE